MLDFCPFEVSSSDAGFKKIDLCNLAYELCFVEGASYEDLENTVLLSAVSNQLIKTGKDERLETCYNDQTSHYMLHERTVKQPENGMRRLLEEIDRNNEKVRNGEEDLYMLCYEYNEKNGTYVISYAPDTGLKNRKIIEAVPCCPSCHQKLPLGWMSADDFCGISLLARRGSGKTTYLTSMLAEDLDCFQHMGPGWTITPAHSHRDPVYREIRRAADELYYNGICPERTNVAYSIPPIFLRIGYGNKVLIAGLYDNSGEVLEKMDPDTDRIRILCQMYAHIYMIHPDELNLADRGKGTLFPEVPLLSLAEQGKLQREHREAVSAQSILEAAEEPERKKKKRRNPMAMYQRLKMFMVSNGLQEYLKKQYMCCTIIMCDLLEKAEELQSISQTLFSREPVSPRELLDESMAAVRQEVLEDQVFSNLVFRSEMEKESLKNDLKGVSLHCISALGCDTAEEEPNHFRLREEYAPIRLEEPVLTCVIRRIRENGWMD